MEHLKMPEWLTESVALKSANPPEQLFVRLAMSVLFGISVALIYRVSHGRQRVDAATLSTTLVLLSILIAMVSMVIGDSVARAFSLVGALSIVRFRTVVEDTRDTAFVIFAVIVGMAAGSGLLVLPLVGIPIVGAVAIMLSRHDAMVSPANIDESTLKIRLGLGLDPQAALGAVLGRYLSQFRLVAAETARQGAALDLTYAGQFADTIQIAALAGELNQIEGVQSVDVRI